MNVLVTGGAGYIGSFAVRELVKRHHQVIVIDDLSTGFQQSVDPSAKQLVGSLLNPDFVHQVFRNHRIDLVMHFAAKVVVPESLQKPLDYFQANVVGGIHLLKACLDSGVKKFIFSSTAAVYGPNESSMLNESASVNPINPYGASKLFMEKIIEDCKTSYGLDYIILRYFNVAGADGDLQLGQRTLQASHLIKVAAEVACGKRDKIEIFGTDYQTLDGTAVRDYIHVQDLVEAHLKALDYLDQNSCGEILNCGYGQGYSVLQVLMAMEKVSGRKITQINSARRPGDSPSVIADAEKMKRILKWQPKFNDIEFICKTAFGWEENI